MNLKVFNYESSDVRVVNMNGEPWFVAKDVESLPDKAPNEWMGFVYALEYGSGIKIGCTTQPLRRIKQLERTARNYSDLTVGRVAFSQPHTNYQENETALHRHFNSYRRGKSERYNLNLEMFLGQGPSLEYLDESKEKEIKSEELFFALKSFVTGGSS